MDMIHKINNLKIYTELGNEILTCKYKFKLPLGTGVYGNVYKYNSNSVIKFQKNIGSFEQYDVVCEVKNLNLPNFYKIQNILSPDKTGSKRYAGTIATYYKEGKENVWTIPSELFINEINSLIDSAIILGKRKIEIVDLNPSNIILTDKGFVIIDIDNYVKRTRNCDRNNEQYINYFLNYFMIYQYFKSSKYDICPESRIEKFLNERDLTNDVVQKKVLKYKNPLEWFYSEKEL